MGRGGTFRRILSWNFFWGDYFTDKFEGFESGISQAELLVSYHFSHHSSPPLIRPPPLNESLLL